MGVTNRHPLKAVLDWLRSGYPEGIPDKDHFALLAVLRRRLSENEINAVVALSIEHAHETPGRHIDYDRVRVLMADALREEPSDEDMVRVSRRLEEGGWPAEEDDSAVPESGTSGNEDDRGESGRPDVERMNAEKGSVPPSGKVD